MLFCAAMALLFAFAADKFTFNGTISSQDERIVRLAEVMSVEAAEELKGSYRFLEGALYRCESMEPLPVEGGESGYVSQGVFVLKNGQEAQCSIVFFKTGVYGLCPKTAFIDTGEKVYTFYFRASGSVVEGYL